MWRSVKVLWRGWLIFFSRTGSFSDIGRKFLFRTFHRWLFSHKLSMCMTLDTLNEQDCQNLYHPGCWGYSFSTFWFFQTSGSFWSTGRDPFSTLGDYVWHQTKPYTFVFTFHVDDSGMRKCEVQQRDGWKSTINWLCTPSEKGIKHYLLSWVTSKE